MYIICSTCGSANPASNKECWKCSMPLGPGDATPPTHAPSPATPRPASSHGASPQTDKPPSTGTPRQEPPPTETIQFTTASYTTRTRATGESPIGLSLCFTQPLWAGQPAEIHLQLRNLGSRPVEQIELSVLSRAFEEQIVENFTVLPGHEMLQFPLRVTPVAAGQFLLTLTLKLKAGDQWKNLINARVLWVNPVPRPEHFPVSAERIKVNRGERGTHLQALWQESGQPAPDTLSSWEKLRGLRLPECFEPLDLALDYQLSVSAQEQMQQRPELYIPRLFITNVQTGTKLKLVPANPDQTLPIVLVARPVFKIGRSRLDSDWISWFWPRSHANDERTRHLSRVHVVMEIRDGRPMLRDAGSTGGSNFDGQSLAADQWEPILRRGTLVMAGEYYLEVIPVAGAFPCDPVIKNLGLWGGPQESAPPPVRGAIHFHPINTSLAHHDAVWLFTDAAFGTSRSNAIVLPDSHGVSEVQGRFHHTHGAFWLENVARNDAIRINYYTLKTGEIAPLINGQLVQLGGVNYHVEIQA